MLARAWGIVRSLVMYHAVPGRHRRMVAFYSQFLQPGDVGFDIGAHVGSRVRAWRKLGVHVVAVEPQPDLVRVLRLLFGRDRDVTLLPSAVGARAGRARLQISTATPTVSSMSRAWTETVARDRRFARIRWDRSVDIDVVTLDDLIDTYGSPAFCKIDVEGFELDVLRGLTRPVTALSLEYLPPAHDEALAVLERVEQLGATAGGYAYNYSAIETLRYSCDRWLDAAELVRLLDRVRPLGRSGDIYARLRSPLGPTPTLTPTPGRRA